jgi:outer membrane receptor protein involved in Fe transport
MEMGRPQSFAPSFALSLVLTWLAAGVASAQTTTGAVQGRVVDASTGDPIPGVTVIATSPSLQGAQAEISDETGAYFIGSLPPGIYEVTFLYLELEVRRTGVQVSVGSTTPVHAKIDTTQSKAQEVIYINEKAPAIDLGSGKRGVKIGKDYLDNIPQAGRDYQGVLGAAAGSQGDLMGVSFSGSTSLENHYTIDGLNTTGLTNGSVGSTLLTNFIEEIEVITGGYDAEFGRSTGGVVNVVTKTGSNDFHGSVWFNVAPGILEAGGGGIDTAGSALSAGSSLDYDMDFGFDLGGPIVKDRLWFYVGFAPILTSETWRRRVSTQVDRMHNDHDYAADPDADGDPSTSRAVGCEVTSSCESDGEPDVNPETGFSHLEYVDEDTFGVKTRSLQFTGKLSFAASPHHQGWLSLSGSSWDGVDVNGVDGTPTATQLANDGLTTDVSAKWTSKLGGNATQLDAVVGWHRASSGVKSAYDTLPDSPAVQSADVPGIHVYDTDLGSVGRNRDRRESDLALSYCTDGDPSIADPFPTITNCPLVIYSLDSPGQTYEREEERVAAKLAVTQRVKFLGHHQLKAGIDGENNALANTRRWTGGQEYTALGGWDVHRYVNVHDGGDDYCGMNWDTGEPIACDYVDELPVHSQTWNWAAFIQDRWDILPNLRLNLGLRYEEQVLKFAEEVRNRPDPLTGEPIGENALELDGLWAPRIGVTYDWTQEGRSKLFASYGRFYESIPLELNNTNLGGEVNYIAHFDWETQCGPPPMPAENVPRLPSDPHNCPMPSLATPPEYDYMWGGAAAVIAPGTSAPYLDEFVAGVEYEPLEDLTVGLTVQNRRLGRVLEDVSVDGANTYIISNPGEFDADAEAEIVAQLEDMPEGPEKDALAARLDMFRRIRDDVDRPTRNYTAVQLTAKKRFSKSFFLQASYTWSRLYGNFPGLFTDNNQQVLPHITSQFDQTELNSNRVGPLPADRPHNVKLDAYYRIDMRDAGALTLGLRIAAQSGKPIEALGSHYSYGASEVFILPRGSSGRTDLVAQADLRVSWARRLGRHVGIEVYLDLINLLNSSSQTEVDQIYTLDNVLPIVGGDASDLPYLKQQQFDDTGTVGESDRLATKQVNWRNTSASQAPLMGRFGVRLTF